MRTTRYPQILAAALLAAALQFLPEQAGAQQRPALPATGSTGRAGAQEAPDGQPGQDTRTWSLHECMQYAVAHSPKMTLQQATNANRRITRREAALDFIPTVSAGVGGTANFGRMIDPETNLYTNTTTFSNSYSLSADLNLFNGFTAVNNLRIARIAVLLGAEEEQATKDNLCLQVIQAYYNVLYYQGMEALAREQLEETRQTLAQARTQCELGLKSPADVLQIEANLASEDFNLTQWKNILEQSLLTLKNVMCYPLSDSLQVATVKPIAPSGTLAPAHDADSLVAAARHTLPDFKIEDYKVRSAKLELQTARWSFVPYIYAQGGYSTGFSYNRLYEENPSFWTQLDKKQGQYVGIGISIPIFNGLYKHHNVARKRNALTTAEANRASRLQQVEVAIRKAAQDLQGAAKEFVAAHQKVKALTLSHQANTRKYEEGLLTIIDLQTSANNLLEAKAQRLNYGLQYLLQERVVQYYQGIHYLNQE